MNIRDVFVTSDGGTREGGFANLGACWAGRDELANVCCGSKTEVRSSYRNVRSWDKNGHLASVWAL